MGGSANPNMVQPQGGQRGFGGGGLHSGMPAGASAYRGGFNQFGADGFGGGVDNQPAPLDPNNAQQMQSLNRQAMQPQPQPATPQNPYQQASQAQTDAMGMTRKGAGMVNTGANIVGGALGALNPAMQRVGQGMTQTAAEGMATYQNPYEDQVVQASMRDIGNQGLNLQNTLGAQAQKAGAFGGSRHGIAEAELAKGTQQQMLDQAAKLRAQGFNTALGASQADIASQLGAAGQSAGMAGQAAGMGGQIAGMGSSMGALGSNLSGLGQTSFGYGQAIQNQQMQQGTMQQQMMQNLINAAKGQYSGYTGAPAQGLNTLLQTISAQPNMTGQTSQFQPGLFNYLQLGASMAPY